MPAKLTFITDDGEENAREPRRPAAQAADPPASEQQPADAWPEVADDLADELAGQQAALIRGRRRDIALGVLLVVGICAFIGLTRANELLFPLVVVVAALAILYIRLRSTPRAKALTEIAARRALIDPKCPQCGYALRHLYKQRCPECGRRVQLPTAEQVREALSAGKIVVSRISVASDLGWVAGLLMVIAGVLAGRLLGAAAGWCAAALPPAVFLVIQAVSRRRAAARVPLFAVCDRCGQSTGLLDNRCAACEAALLAEHVYVKPGLRGPSDPRLYCTWAQLAGGACVVAMLVLNGISIPMPAFASRKLGPWMLFAQFALAVLAGLFFYRDQRLVRGERLRRYDESTQPLCHHCLSSLTGQPANGACPGCGKAYLGIELAGGLRPRATRPARAVAP